MKIKNYDDTYEVNRVVRWEEKKRAKWEKDAPYSPNVTIDTCARRVIYGGRKGKRAAYRMGLWVGDRSGRRVTKYEAYAVLMNDVLKYRRAIAQYRAQYKRNQLRALGPK